MAAWLARSLADSLGIDDVPGPDNHSDHPKPAAGDVESSFSKYGSHIQSEKEEKLVEAEEDGDQLDSPTRRVKEDLEDLTELRETLTRRLLGVANFLAPPPATTASDHHPVSDCNPRDSSHPSVSGYDESSGDGLKVGGRFADGFSAVSNDRVALENLRFGPWYNRYGSVYEEDENWISEAVGITDEVLAFAGNIAHHPETWLDFPIEEEDDLDDFHISETQKVHALAVECLSPRLAALRIELCPAHMSDGYFWKVYFVLLHSRLNKQDAELLSTPQVVETRVKWMQELQKRTKTESGWHRPKKYCNESTGLLHEDFVGSSPDVEHSDNMQHSTYALELASAPTILDSESERHLFASKEVHLFDKPTVEENQLIKTVEKSSIPCLSPRILLHNFEDDDDDDWPEDDFSGQGKIIAAIPVGIDEEVSFSDLEDDDCILPIKPKVGSKD
ncbi:hypothetical protein Ancab_016578 [Ancistrocladus abbreviatus]